VRRKRNDSVPVSMMCARSVIRSNNALHDRGFGNTAVHSENGRFVVTMRAARSEVSGYKITSVLRWLIYKKSGCALWPLLGRIFEP